jgi:glycosyltransferase involved in cell wall biosynthesis
VRILIAHFFINDFGGIINNTEGLVRGFAELGHEAVPYMLEWRHQEDIHSHGSNVIYGASESTTGLKMDQRYGLRFTPEHRVGYKGTMKHWKRLVKEFDLVIWQIPVPTRLASNRGNSDWLDLYDIKVPQVGYSHDGNIAATPWISLVAGQWKGMGCVHPCALAGAKMVLPLQMSLTPSPQWDIEERMSIQAKRRRGWLSLQTFKRWKRVDAIIRAIPYMTHRGPRTIAGGGIERYYMTSKTKVKPVYTWRRGDRGYKKAWKGRPIWDVAEEHGMEYLDFIGNEARDDILRRSMALIDASWSNTYATYGAHFNRVAIDALICGAIPIMRNWNDQRSPLKPGIHFMPLPPDEDPIAFAHVVDEMCTHDRTEWVQRAQEILPLWDCKNVAETFLELAEGQGMFKGKKDRQFYIDGANEFDNFFAGQ